MKIHSRINATGRQQGAALLMGLLLLALVTLVAVAAVSSSSLQVRMTRSSLYTTAAFQAAEDTSNIILDYLIREDSCNTSSGSLYQQVKNKSLPVCSGTLAAPAGMENALYLTWEAKASEPRGAESRDFIFTITAKACSDKANGNDCAVSVREQGYRKNI